MKLFETKINASDAEKICDVLKAGQIGFGQNVALFEKKFAEFSKKKYNVATNSASASAFMIFAYLHHLYGSCDVYTTALGFVSPSWAAKHFGHRLIFVDVNEELQFDVKDYANKRKLRCERYTDGGIKPVVMPILYGGVSTINGFDDFFKNSNYPEIIVVDSAQCVTPTIKSDFVFFSFHPYKPICTSDGGMISTDRTEANTYFRSYRNFGRSPRFPYTYDVTQDGFKFYMNNLNATIGLTQMEKYHENLNIRKRNYAAIAEQCTLLPHDNGSSFYFATTYCDNGDTIMTRMNLSRHYPMLHQMKYFKNENTASLPTLERVFDKIVNIPIHQNLTASDISQVFKHLKGDLQ